jgi:Zn-finger nucleic acid-binding protein
MSAYRDAAQTCPSCRRSLRTFGRRLVCDECGGLWIAERELAQELADIGAEQIAIVARDGGGAPCPRCGQPTKPYALTAVGLSFEGIAWCATDGVWLTARMAEEMIEQVARRAHRTQRWARIGSSFVRRPQPGLAISRWWDKPKPRVTVPFRSAFAGSALACPDCAPRRLREAGELWRCDACTGAFVENAAIEDMVGQIRREPWQLPEASGARGTRTCPVCAEALALANFAGVAVERCPLHGVWFEPGRLQMLLERAGRAPKP